MRRFVSPLVLALLLAGFLAGVAQAREAVKGPGYRTFAPSGWHIDKRTSSGWRTVTITPPGHVSNQRDTALVSIAVAPVRTVEKAVRGSVRDRAKLVQQLISIPRNAVSVQQAYPPRPTTVRGKSGFTFGVTYNFKGTGTEHTATVVRRGKRIYLLQQITDQGLSELSSSAADMVLDSWRWK